MKKTVTRKRLLRFAVLALLALMAWWIVSAFVWRGTVKFANLEGVTTINIDGERLKPLKPSVRLGVGKHTVVISGPLIETRSEIVNVGPLSSQQIGSGGKLLTEEELAKQLSRDDPRRSDFNVVRALLLENDSWLIFTLVDPDGKVDGSDYIFRYENTVWRLVEQGTGLNYYTLNSVGLPRSVLEAIGSR